MTYCWNSIESIISLVSSGRLVRNRILFGVSLPEEPPPGAVCVCVCVYVCVYVFYIASNHIVGNNMLPRSQAPLPRVLCKEMLVHED